VFGSVVVDVWRLVSALSELEGGEGDWAEGGGHGDVGFVGEGRLDCQGRCLDLDWWAVNGVLVS